MAGRGPEQALLLLRVPGPVMAGVLAPDRQATTERNAGQLESVTHCEHQLGYAGRGSVEDGARASLSCEQPTQLRCRLCDWTMFVRCGTARASACGPCGETHRGRVQVVARSGLVVGRDGLFITLTAPGDRPHRMPDGRRCPCTPPGGVNLGLWNAELGRRWNRLVTELRRQLGGLEYVRVVEVQRRGALHVHALLRSSDGRPLALSGARLRRAAMLLGFGHSVDVQAVASSHAAYVAKYCAKAADSRAEVPWIGWRHVGGSWLNTRTGEIVEVERKRVRSFSPTYRAWTTSRGWGWTMGNVREAQQHHVLVLASLPDWTDRPSRPAWAYGDVPPVPGWAREHSGHVDSPLARGEGAFFSITPR